ncbi:MAG TPA: zf-HC2 domain-containing protein [Candidatus Eisenbacteria bacterium]|jgi:hypothetical protein
MRHEVVHPTPEELFAYRDGELPAEKRALLEAHVTTCRACREFIDRVSGLEAALKRRPDSVEGDYYASLSQSVLRKIGARESAGGGAAARPEPPPRERRRPLEPEGPRLSRAPALPWGALVSTVAAAAAVVVVVVMLFRQGAVEPPRLVTGPGGVAPRGEAPAESVRVARSGAPAGGRAGARPQAAKPAAPRAAVPVAPPAALPTAERAPAAAADRASALGKAAQMNEPVPPVPDAEATRGKDERAGGSAEESSAAPQPAGALEAPVPTSPYISLVRRFRLPEIWTEGGVPDDGLRLAEPALRLLYVTGRAGADSARVRLYLAEATRLRYESEPDSALYATVVHHYWRAIRLAGGQPDVARTARERLDSFTR